MKPFKCHAFHTFKLTQQYLAYLQLIKSNYLIFVVMETNPGFHMWVRQVLCHWVVLTPSLFLSNGPSLQQLELPSLHCPSTGHPLGSVSKHGHCPEFNVLSGFPSLCVPNSTTVKAVLWFSHLISPALPWLEKIVSDSSKDGVQQYSCCW